MATPDLVMATPDLVMATPDLAQRDAARRSETKLPSEIMSYFVYVLQSLKNNDLYIGSTEDVQNRFKRHNSGKVKSTKAYRPWKLLETIECSTRSEAVRLECFMKSHQQKEFLKRKYGLVAK